MRNTFLGYYRPTEIEFSRLWKKCLFVLDANVLLNIYRYSPSTRQELIDILTKISDRLWVPYQAATEYQQRRLDVIEQQSSAYEQIQNSFTTAQNKLESDLKLFSRHPFINVDSFINKLKTPIDEIKRELDRLKREHPNLLDGDDLRDTITDLHEGKVGLPYTKERLEEIYKIGKERYDRSTPPGFQDKNKDGMRKYGDLVLWFQILDQAKSTEKPIIFITDDKKDDWWLKFNGKTLGPHPELIHEMLSEAKVNFYMYQTEQFMEYAHKYIDWRINRKAINEVRDIKKRDDEERKQRTIEAAALLENMARLSNRIEDDSSENSLIDYKKSYENLLQNLNWQDNYDRKKFNNILHNIDKQNDLINRLDEFDKNNDNYDNEDRAAKYVLNYIYNELHRAESRKKQNTSAQRSNEEKDL